MRFESGRICVQYFAASPNARTNPSRVNATKLIPVTSTARTSRRSSRYSTKIAGVSLNAATKPISSPRGHGVLRGSRSASTSAISSRFTWP